MSRVQGGRVFLYVFELLFLSDPHCFCTSGFCAPGGFNSLTVVTTGLRSELIHLPRGSDHGFSSWRRGCGDPVCYVLAALFDLR